jgi:DnaJ like chaperone protein
MANNRKAMAQSAIGGDFMRQFLSYRPSSGNRGKFEHGARSRLALIAESTILRRHMSIWSRIGQAASVIGDSVSTFLAKITQPRSNPEMSIAFTIGVIALGAKMAKADGVVTGEEIAAFKQVFHVPERELSGVARVFNLAKQDVAGYDAYARQLARLFAQRPQVLEDVVDSLFHIAKADAAVHERELAFLQSVAEIFGFTPRDFSRIKARHLVQPRDDPYVVLGIEPFASDDELRKHYRKMVRENHPDKHIAAGMPPEMINVATERLARINAAYETIARERGL